MIKSGRKGSEYWRYASNKSRLLNDDGNFNLPLKRLSNLGDPKSAKRCNEFAKCVNYFQQF